MSIGDTKINTYVSETVDRMMEDSMILKMVLMKQRVSL